MKWKRSGFPLVFIGMLFILAKMTSVVGQEPLFNRFPVGDEINDASLQTIYQDNQGFLWLGTSTGLYRYDGIRYLQMNAEDSLKDASYTAIYEDTGHTLWAGTKTGIIVTVSRGKMIRFKPEEGTPSSHITGITEDASGQIWFSTYGEGVYCWTGKRLYNLDSDDGLGDDFTYCLVNDYAGNVWVGTDGGISVCNFLNGKKNIIPVNALAGLPDNIVLSLAVTADSSVWVGMHDGGICRINIASHKIETPEALWNLATGPVNDLLIAGQRLWAASENQGIISVDLHHPGSYMSFRKINGVTSIRMKKVLRDFQDNIWFLSTDALIRTPGDKLEILTPENNTGFSNIKSIIIARNGAIWFSNDHGLFRYVPQSGTVSSPEQFLSGHIHPGMHIVSLYEDRDGFIWAGTFGQGIFRLDPESGHTRNYSKRNGLANNNVLSIAGMDNEIWFATLGGASRCLLPDNSKSVSVRLAFEEFREESGLGNNFIYSVFVDSKKRVWFATDGKGITVYENSRFRNFSDEEGVKSKIVYSITQEQNGHIWFTSSNAGLFHYDGESFRNFTQKNGLSELAITGLAAATSPVIFIVHPKGIDILDPITEKISNLGEEDGLGELNSNLNAVAADRMNDQIWIGTDKGIIKLSAADFRNPYKPLMRLKSVKVFLTDTDTNESHVFSYDRNHFTFDFVGLWYKSPDRVQYQVLLEGYDLDWIPTRNTSVIYSSLSPGNYTFRARASLNYDFSDSNVVVYHFDIRKPFWKTAWFIGLAIVLAGGLIYLIIRTREQRLLNEENLQKEKLLFQLQTLKNQVNPHFLFNSFSTLSAIIDEDKEMALDYVQKLSAFFRNILEYRDKQVISLEEELSLADTYYYLQKKRYGANFNLLIEIPDEYLNTWIPPLTLQMIIENAVKHNVISADKPLSVRIFVRHDRIVITNTLQARKNIKSSTGVGLQNIRSRYRLLAGSDIDFGISNDEYIVSLPVIKSNTL